MLVLAADEVVEVAATLLVEEPESVVLALDVVLENEPVDEGAWRTFRPETVAEMHASRGKAWIHIVRRRFSHKNSKLFFARARSHRYAAASRGYISFPVE